jgi:hypothetical protein
LADQSIKGSAKAVDLRVGALLLKAKASFAERFRGMDEKLRDSLIKSIISSYRLVQYDEALIKCPACDNDAVASGAHEVVDWEADFDREGNPEGAYPVVELFADSFQCSVCRLKLASSDELKAAGIEPAIELEDINPEDFYESEQDHDDY